MLAKSRHSWPALPRAAAAFLSYYGEWWRLFRASWHSGTASIAAQCLMVVAVALAGRGLGAAAYGSVVTVVSLFGWFSLLANYATYVALPRLLADPARGGKEKARACATAFWLTVAFTGAATAAAILFLPAVADRLGVAVSYPLALLYAPVFALAQIRLTLDGISLAAGWLRRWSASGIAATALPVLLLLVALSGGTPLTPTRYLWLLLMGGGAATFFSSVLLVQRLGGWRGLRPDAALVRPLLAAGGGPWVALFSNVLLGFGIKTLIAAGFPSRELGQFDIVGSLGTWVQGIGLAVTVPATADWARLAAAGRLNELRRDFRRRQAATTVVLGTAALAGVLAAEPILRALYGADFAGAAPLLRLSALVWLISGAGGWYMFFLYALGHPGRVAVPNLMAGVLGFALTAAAIRFTSLGVMGAAWAGLIGNLGWLVAYEWHFRRALRQEARAPAGS